MKRSFFNNNQFDTLGKATIVPSMSKRTGGGSGTRKRRRTGKTRTSTSVRLVKGRVVLRVPGFQGVQRLAPSHLITHITKKNLKSAAKSVLRKTNKKSISKKRKRTKGRGRRRRRGGRK